MHTVNAFEFVCPVKTNSGNRSLENLPLELASLNAEKPLIITSRGKVADALIRKFVGAFGNSGMNLGIFDGVTDNADMSTIEQLADIYRDTPYDSLIALGSDMVMDTAKVLNLSLSLRASDSGKLTAQINDNIRLRPLIAVPTAAASGLETAKYAFFAGEVFSSFSLMPNLAVIDPRMIRSNDAKTIAAAGMAALGRALEAYIVAARNPFTEAYAFSSIRFLVENLLPAVRKPGTGNSGMAVANATVMSGCAFSNCAARLFQIIGQVFRQTIPAHSGIFLGICLPYVLDHYGKKGKDHLEKLLLPLAGPDLYAATPAARRAEMSGTIVHNLLKDLYAALGNEMPATLPAAGVPHSLLEDALNKIRPQYSAADAETSLAILDAAWKGKSVF